MSLHVRYKNNNIVIIYNDIDKQKGKKYVQTYNISNTVKMYFHKLP